MNLTFRLTLSSDYHVASGQGLGGTIDSALFRDADGVPAIRGTSIEGLVRDQLRRLLALPMLAMHRGCRASWPDAPDGAVEPHCTGDKVCPVCAIAGSPGRPKSWVFSSLRPESLREPVAARWTPGRSASRAVSRVRVSPRLRRAEARKLFRQEEGDSNLAFVFTTTHAGEMRQPLAEAALLVAAARMVRRFGLSRRRGRGSCEVSLIAADPQPEACPAGSEQAALLDMFERHWIRGEPLAAEPPATAWHPVAARPDSGSVRLRVIVRADEPVIVSRRGEAGNQFESHPVIPGGAVAGALAARAASRWGLGQAKTDGDLYRTFVDVFRRGVLQCSPLLPAVIQHNLFLSPAIVAPRDLFTCKRFPGFRFGDADPGHGVWALAAVDDPPSECRVCAGAGHTVPLEPLGDFVTVGGVTRSVEARLSPEMHIRLDPRTGRVGEGALFGYLVLPAGQHFIGEVCCRGETALATVQELTGSLREGMVTSLRLGRAHRRGYGLISLWCDTLQSDVPAADRPRSIDDRVSDPSDWLVMTLLSPAILVDAWGRHRLGFDPDWLESTILPDGVRLEQRDQKPVVKPFCASEIIDGFNLHLGLPRWRDVALAAGSTVGMRLARPVNMDMLRARLRQLEEEGIGLRRDEGFGRVAFNHSVYALERNAGETIPCPEPLRLSGASSTHRVPKEGTERLLWLDHLDEKARARPTPFQDIRWTAVARWLRHRASDGVPAIIADLARVGRAGFAGLGLPSGRGPKELFDPKGLDELRELLQAIQATGADALASVPARERIEMLAEWIADLSSSARKEH